MPAAAVGESSKKVVEANIAIITETAERLLYNKRWTTKGFASVSAVGKIVDGSIFCEKGKEKTKGDSGGNDGLLGLSPAKPVGMMSKSPMKSASKPRKPSFAADVDSPSKSPAKSPMKRRQDTDDDDLDGMSGAGEDGGDAFDFGFGTEGSGAKASTSAQGSKRKREPHSASSHTKVRLTS